MEAKLEYISAACNCTYNCMELADTFVLFGTHKALAIYDLEQEKVTQTLFAHKGRVNCVRFIKNTTEKFEYAISCCAGGAIIILKLAEDDTIFKYKPIIQQVFEDQCYTVCCGIQTLNNTLITGYISSESKISIDSVDLKDLKVTHIQEINLNRSLANDLVFHSLEDESVILGLALDTGAVTLYNFKSADANKPIFELILTLQKHEDWVRCIDFVNLENGETLLASGGQDSFIAVWRFTKSSKSQSGLEFQVHKYKNYSVIFDSMIIGHEGWINSLHWNSEGELLSCSSDQSIIIWENLGDLWMETTRLGVIGGMIPGGCCAKYYMDRVISSGFQGAVQVWEYKEGDWELRPSITGHFRQISDMDYDPKGNYVVSTSEDQTTRVHAPWGKTRWHEIARPQIHGHDLFACRTIGDMIISGAEEKILRAFQPTEVFYKSLEDASNIHISHKEAAKAAFLPSLGLSNQTEDNSTNSYDLDIPIETRLDEDFIRSQTLWLEASKLYGHVYEIACIATSPVDSLIASASQATKQQFAAIILWCANRWKNLGDFQYHKLNVTGMEFSPDGSRLLSVSRDRTWAVWKVIKSDSEPRDFKIEVTDTGAVHTRALWVGTWGPKGDYFVTGARDKKLIIWNRINNQENDEEKYKPIITETLPASVSAAAVNSDNQIAIGLETGQIEIFQLSLAATTLQNILKLGPSSAHHETVRRLRFNPTKKSQLASAGADNILKIYELIV